MTNYIKTNQDKEFTDGMRTAYHLVNSHFGTTARISNIFEMFKIAFSLEDYSMLDTRVVQNATLESYLMDKQIEWMSGQPVDFKEVYEALLTAGDFSMSEIRRFELGNAGEKLWAIFLAITDPTNNNNI
jgi:hypothetical protein